MPRNNRCIEVKMLPIEKVQAEHPCPWIRATEVLIQSAERLGLPLYDTSQMISKTSRAATCDLTSTKTFLVS